jgi:hypothetical protein
MTKKDQVYLQVPGIKINKLFNKKRKNMNLLIIKQDGSTYLNIQNIQSISEERTILQGTNYQQPCIKCNVFNNAPIFIGYFRNSNALKIMYRAIQYNLDRLENELKLEYYTYFFRNLTALKEYYQGNLINQFNLNSINIDEDLVIKNYNDLKLPSDPSLTLNDLENQIMLERFPKLSNVMANLYGSSVPYEFIELGYTPQNVFYAILNR